MKYILLLLLASFAGNAYAQKDDPVTVMSKIMCECIENASEEEWGTNPSDVLNSCERGAVLGGLISTIPVDDEEEDPVEETTTTSTTTEIGENEMEEAYLLLEKNCEKYQDYIKSGTEKAKEDENIEAISKEACGCLDDVSQGLQREAMYDEIKECIEGAITSAQIQSKLFGTLEQLQLNDSTPMPPATGTEDSTASPKNVTITIVTDLNYKEVEEHLLRNCERMKRLLTTENQQNELSVSDKEEAVRLYQEGMDVYRAKDFEGAIGKFKKALRKDKNFAFAYDMVGISYRHMNDYKNALKYYRKSLEIDPIGRMPLMNIPIAYSLQGNYDDAVKGYLKFIDTFPEDPEGFYGIGRMYHVKGDYENALDNMMKAYVLYNESNSPYARDAETNLGIFYRELKAENNLELFERMAKKHKIDIGSK